MEGEGSKGATAKIWGGLNPHVESWPSVVKGLNSLNGSEALHEPCKTPATALLRFDHHSVNLQKRQRNQFPLG